MPPTPHDHVNILLERLLTQMQAILDDRLIGLYLYGSLVTGDFDDSSDVDLLAVLSADLDPATFDSLDEMHQTIVANDPQWADRIEIAYLSQRALQTFRTRPSPIGIISPGEPFHIIKAGIDWLMNWYNVRKRGVTLVGPSPDAFIEPISDDEYVRAVQAHMVMWPDWIAGDHDLPFQSYTILTLCRGFYTIKSGEYVSKARAAAWAAQQYPMWAATIQNAVLWRQGRWAVDLDPAATLPETRRFVRFMVDQILRLGDSE
jgi:hypothetical protein